MVVSDGYVEVVVPSPQQHTLDLPIDRQQQKASLYAYPSSLRVL